MAQQTAKQQYRMAYQLVRLRTYQGAVAEQWDYAHKPSEEEIHQAWLYQQVIDDCNRQREAIEPLVQDTYLEAAYSCYLRRLDRVPRPKLAHLANNFGIAPFGWGRFRTDERDYYIGQFNWRMVSRWMGEDWNKQQRERFIRRAREVFGLSQPIEQPPTDLDGIPF